MRRFVFVLISIVLGIAIAWFVDTRRRRGADTLRATDLVAPTTPMSGPRGAGRPADLTLGEPAGDDLLVQPTRATAGPLPLVDEAAGGHQVLGGGPSADSGRH